MTTTITEADRIKSRLTERLAGTAGKTDLQQLPLAIVKSADGKARAWRVTMSRAERADNAALLAPNGPELSSPLYVGQLYNYTAGFETAPAVPPRRTNPVFGPQQTNIGQIFVEIRFGQEEGRPLMMLGHWPMLGGSVVVYGSFVEVWGGFRVNNALVVQGQMASLQAMITPADGIDPRDAGELGLTQEVLVEPVPPNGAVFYIPDFARRVRVTCVAQATERVPLTGEPLAQMVWYGERGEIVDGALHGTLGMNPFSSPDLWYTVPPAAVLLGLYRDPAAADFFALLHWRIAP
jgi:hypothetical protein